MTKAFVQKISIQFRWLYVLSLFCSHFFYSGICQSNSDTKDFKADSMLADQLNADSKKYWQKNLDSSVFYAQKALQLSTAINYKRGIAESYRCIGVANTFGGNNKVARPNLFKALALFSSSHDEKGKAATYNNLGVLYTHITEFSTGLIYLDSALTLFRKLGNKEGEGSALNYIGMNYQQQGNYQKAIDYNLQAFEIRKKINDHPGVVYSLINVGNLYLDVGQPQTALNFYNQSIAYAQGHNMEPLDYSLNQVGKTYLKLKHYDKAEAYIIRTINEHRVIDNHLSVGELYLETGRLDSAIKHFNISLEQNKALSLIGLSKVYLKKGEYKAAMSYAKQAYNITDSSQNKLTLTDAANLLAQLYKITGDYKKSIHFFELAHSITDSVTSENYLRKLAFTESKNEIENEQAKVKLLSAEQKLQKQKLKDEQFIKNLILAVFAIAIILAIIIFRNINDKRKKIQHQRDQIELQRAKIEKSYEELKVTQAQLVQREKMASLGELTAGIAHEIQNPLNFVNNFSEVNSELIEEMNQEIDKGNLDGVKLIANDIKDNEQKINHHGKRADAIVKGMLQHSRSSVAVKEPTDINDLADEYLRLSYHGLRAKDKAFNATIRTDFDKNLEPINIIPQDIGRVLLNLFTNAFYSVTEKAKQQSKDYEPTICVTTRMVPLSVGGLWGVEIRVRDNGMGIPQKILDKIYQPFFSTKPTGQGTGLGLSISYDVIKSHEGEMKVETKEGEYAEFIILLPYH
jgi:signal transduction histidine kinase